MGATLTVVNEQKLNFVQLEEKYGSAFVEELGIDHKIILDRGSKWKFEILEEDEYFITFALATKSQTYIYEINKNLKRLRGYYSIGSVFCMQVMNLMNSMKDEIDGEKEV